MERPGRKLGLTSGRSWSELPENEAPIELSCDVEGDYIQGPVKLEEMRGLRIFLHLQEGQVAVLAAPEGLRAVYLDGGHNLEIGHGVQQVDADHELFLMNTEPIKLRWTKEQPLCCANEIGIIGNCRLCISAPTRFFRALWNQERSTGGEANERPDAGTMMARVDEILRETLADLLIPAHDHGDSSAGEIQSRLTGLTPADLSDELEPWGLQCVSLAAYTAAPPVEGYLPETAGQLSVIVHN